MPSACCAGEDDARGDVSTISLNVALEALNFDREFLRGLEWSTSTATVTPLSTMDKSTRPVVAHPLLVYMTPKPVLTAFPCFRKLSTAMRITMELRACGPIDRKI